MLDYSNQTSIDWIVNIYLINCCFEVFDLSDIQNFAKQSLNRKCFLLLKDILENFEARMLSADVVHYKQSFVFQSSYMRVAVYNVYGEALPNVKFLNHAT